MLIPTFSVQNNELFSRDISGTVFSLVMIIVLVVSMYLLMKHRMQVRKPALFVCFHQFFEKSERR